MLPARNPGHETMGARGFEPRTSPLSGVRSSRLSYAPLNAIFGITFCKITCYVNTYGVQKVTKSHRKPWYTRRKRYASGTARRDDGFELIATSGVTLSPLLSIAVGT